MRSIVIGTFLPPTTGHLALIRFGDRLAHVRGRAAGLPSEGVVVVVQHRRCEPVSGRLRTHWLRLEFTGSPAVRVVDQMGPDHEPQRPRSEDDREFWSYWAARVVLAVGGLRPGDVLVSSEEYGERLARELGIEHFPCDPQREVGEAVSATAVRGDPESCFGYLAPKLRSRLRTTVTFFGAESCGKTTLSRRVAADLRGLWLHEWARPRMELRGDTEVTSQLMSDIVRGQWARQASVADDDPHWIVCRDTDLLSTLGYYPIFGAEPTRRERDICESDPADLYIFCPSTIPFEPDPLRFGGDRRQGSDAYWLRMLTDRGLPLHVMAATSPESRAREAGRVVREHALIRSRLWGHRRD